MEIIGLKPLNLRGHSHIDDDGRVRAWKIGVFRRLLSVYLVVVVPPVVLLLLRCGQYGGAALSAVVTGGMITSYWFLARKRLELAVNLFIGLGLAGTALFLHFSRLNDGASFLFFYMLTAGVFLGFRLTALWAAAATVMLLAIAGLSDFYTIFPTFVEGSGGVRLESGAHHFSSIFFSIWTGASLSVLVDGLIHRMHDAICEDNLALRQEALERRQVEDALWSRTQELDSRIRELDLLYDSSRQMDRPNQEPEAVYQMIVDRLPEAWPCPGGLSARIEAQGREYLGPNFEPSPDAYSRPIVVGGATHAVLEIVPRRDGDKGEVCLQEGLSEREARFVDAVVDRLAGWTEQRQLRERLRQGEKMEAIGRLAGGIAHDFNNLLLGVIGAAEVLRIRLADQTKHRGLVDMVLKSANRSAELIQQLLDCARSGRSRCVAVDLHEVVGDVIETLERDCGSRIRVRSSFEASSAVVMGDPAQLHSVFLNLGLNARDAMPDGGELIFASEVVHLDQGSSASPPGVHSVPSEGGVPCLRMVVRDTGIGMDRATRQQVFEPFFTTKAVGSGTGMGLASAYGTVRNHDGFISVESQPGEGATFTVDLPVGNGESQLQCCDEPLEPSLPVLGVRILLIEDHEVVGRTVQEILEQLGCACTLCTDGKAGIQEFSQSWRDIDLVLLDIMMPVMGGHQTFEQMRLINRG